jgi:excisionase family DNA binding protein
MGSRSTPAAAQAASDSPLIQGDVPLNQVLQQLLAGVNEIRQQLAGNRKELMSVNDVAQEMSRSAFTIRRWISEGRINATRVAATGPKGKLLIARSELNKLV